MLGRWRNSQCFNARNLQRFNSKELTTLQWEGHLGATPFFGIQPGAWHSSNNQVQSGECHFLSALHEFFRLLWRVGVCAQIRAQTIGDSTRDNYKVVVLLEQFEFLLSTTRLPITKSKARSKLIPQVILHNTLRTFHHQHKCLVVDLSNPPNVPNKRMSQVLMT